MHRPQFVLLEMDKINVLTQHRRIFSDDDIKALADNICQCGLLDPIIVVAFSQPEARKYIDLINNFYKTEHHLSEMKLVDGFCQVVISGERRLRAHRFIWDCGCSLCREIYGQEECGACFGRHFNKRKKNKKIESRLYRDLPALEAIDIQLSGNNYVPPKEQEMLESYSLQYCVRKKSDPKLTIAQFARSVGRSPNTMRGYLKVCDLPDNVYNYYKQGFIPYGIALELAFLKDQGENSLEFWAMRAIVSRMKVEMFHKIVRKHVRTKNQTVLEIFDESFFEKTKKLHIRKTVAKEIINDLHAGNAYWQKVLRLFEEGKLGRGDSPFSEGSPVNLYRKQIDLIKDHILPHLSKFLPKNSLEQIEGTLTRMDMVLVGTNKHLKAVN